MNWTEGALARHSRRKGWDKDAARQKEYFAKARARKHESSNTRNLNLSAFIPEYIPQHTNSRHQSPSSSKSTPNKANRSRKRPTYLQHKPPERNGAGPEGSTPSRRGSSSTGTIDGQYSSPRHETLDAKRRRLLSKSDWTGVSLQKPVVVEFSWQRDDTPREGVGRQGEKQIRRNHIAERPQNNRKTHKIIDSSPSSRRNEDVMRLRIGNQSLRWSRGSNSIRSPASHRGSLPTFEVWRSQQEHFSSPRASSNLATRNSCVSESTRRHGRSTHDNSSILSNRGSVAGDPQMSSSPASNLPRKRRKVSDDPRVIIRSSPPPIHHPQPTRGGPLALLNIRSPDSETAASTKAQVGISYFAPDPICREDRNWKRWLNSSRSVNGMQDENEPQEDGEIQQPISPGVSQYWTQYKSRSLSSLDPSEEVATEQTFQGCKDLVLVISSQSSSDVSDVEDSDMIAPPRRVTPRAAISNVDMPMQGRNSAVRSIDPTKELPNDTSLSNELILSSAPQLPKAPNAQDLMDLLIEEEKLESENNPTLEHGEERSSEDEDEIWKRFVFDDNVQDIKRRALDEAKKQTTQDLCQVIADSASNYAEPPSTLREQASMSPQPVTTPELQVPSDIREEELLTSSEAPATDATNSVIAQAGSPTPTSHTDFKFHHPQPFVGRLASHISTDVNFNSPPSYQRRRGRTRSRKRRMDGRPDFRAMPDFDGDPIEES